MILLFHWVPFFCRERKRKSVIRSILLGTLFLLCFCLMLVIPTVVQIHSYPFLDIDPLKIQSVIAKANSTLKQCERTSFFPMDDRIFLGVSIILTIIFILLAKTIKQNPTEDHSLSRGRTINPPFESNGSSGTKRRKGSNRCQSSNREPGKPEDTPLLKRHQAGGTAQQSDRTALPTSASPFVGQKFSFGIRLSLHMKLIF